MRKKFVLASLVILSIFMMTGCGGSAIAKLQGNDLIAYEMMLEVCYNAKDPAKVSVISGSVGNTIGVFKVSYGGAKTYNVMVSKENGKYVAEKLHDYVANMYRDMLYETNDFSIVNVNRALQEKWKR